MIQTLEQARALRWQREILAMARMLAPDEDAVRDWYAGDAIVALDHLTAAQLVRRGQGERVVAFLLGIARAEQKGGRASTRAEAAALQRNGRDAGLAACQAISAGNAACCMNRSISGSNTSLIAPQ